MRELPKFVTCWRDRHGHTRYRFRRAGVSMMLPPPESSDFWAAYADAMAAKPKVTQKVRQGSLEHAAQLFLIVNEFREAKPDTQRTYRRYLRAVTTPYGHTMAGDWTRRQVAKAINKPERPTHRNDLRRGFRMLFNIAINEGWRTDNPVTGTKAPKFGKGAKTWGAEEVKAFRSAWAIGTRQRAFFELLFDTGQRIGDVCEMHQRNLSEGGIFVVQGKTDEPLWLPLSGDTRAALDALPPNQSGYLAETDKGAKRSKYAAVGWFSKAALSAIEMPGFTAHGLRKAKATMLADAGASERMIMAVTGHRTSAEVTNYTRAANQRKLAQQAAELLANTVNPSEDDVSTNQNSQ